MLRARSSCGVSTRCLVWFSERRTFSTEIQPHASPPAPPCLSHGPHRHAVGRRCFDDPEAAPKGRPRRIDKREVIEAILYVLHAGCAWRLPSPDFPPRRMVYHRFRCRQRRGDGHARTARSSWPPENMRTATLDLPPRSSTAEPSGRRIENGSQSVRCRKADQGPQTARPDRRRWPPARRRGPRRRTTGS